MARKTTGERLRAWRLSQELSQTAAGALVGVQQGTWSDWESGQNVPTLWSATQIERVTEGAIKAADWAHKPGKRAA